MRMRKPAENVKNMRSVLGFELNGGFPVNFSVPLKFGGTGLENWTAPKLETVEFAFQNTKDVVEPPKPGGKIKNTNTKKPMRLTLHGTYLRNLSESLFVEPSFMMQSTGGATELALQLLFGMPIKENIKLRFGPGYRLGDAAQLFLGLDYDQFRAGISYDINVSSLRSASKYQGGFEIGGYYIIKIYSKKEVPTRILCPHL